MESNLTTETPLEQPKNTRTDNKTQKPDSEGVTEIITTKELAKRYNLSVPSLNKYRQGDRPSKANASKWGAIQLNWQYDETKKRWRKRDRSQK